MVDPTERELRQIKRILLAILVCLIIITLSLIPAVLPEAILIGGIFLIAVFGSAMAQTARIAIRQLCQAVSHYWRQ